MKLVKFRTKNLTFPSSVLEELKAKKYVYYVLGINKKDIIFDGTVNNKGNFDGIVNINKGDIIASDFGRDFPEEVSKVNLPKNILYLDAGVLSGLKNVESLCMHESQIKELSGQSLMGGAIQYLTLPNIVEIPRALCFDCKNLESITIPFTVEKISNNAFAGCSSLSTVWLQYAKKIGVNAFARTAIKEVAMPPYLECLYLNAFEDCPNLRKIKFAKFNPELEIELSGCSQEKFNLDDETWFEILKYNAKAINLIPVEKLYNEKYETDCINAIVEGKMARAAHFGITESRMKTDDEEMDFVTEYLQKVKDCRPDRMSQKMNDSIQKFKNHQIINPSNQETTNKK